MTLQATDKKAIRVLIVDADSTLMEPFAELLESYGCSVIAVAANYDEAMLLLNEFEIDIVLVDIDLKGRRSGLDLGRTIYNNFRKPFIFMAALNRLSAVPRAIDARPSGCLSKPLDAVSVVVSIHGALYYANAAKTTQSTLPGAGPAHFFLKTGDKFRKMFWSDIVYLRAEHRYTFIFNACDGSEYPIRSTLLKTIEDNLPRHLNTDFVQINRAEVVHLRHITEVSGDVIKTPFNTMHITETYSRSFKNRMPMLL